MINGWSAMLGALKWIQYIGFRWGNYYQKLLLQTRVDQNLKASIDAALFTDQNEMFFISKDMREGSQNVKFEMGLNYRKPQNY